MRVAQPEVEEAAFNPYEVLGIRKWASLNEVKRAYFGLVRKYSPEIYPEKFIEIRKAYDILRDSQRRASVDILIFNEIPGGIGFKGIEVKAESLVKLNKEIRDLERKGVSLSTIETRHLIDLLRRRSLVYVQKTYWHEAIADWNRILQLDPKDRECRKNLILGYSRLAFSYAQNGLLAKAVEAWKEILKWNPRCIEAIHNIAIASTKLNNASEEREYWERTLELWGQQLEKGDGNEYLKNLILETHKYFGGRFMPRKKEGVQLKQHEEVISRVDSFSGNLQLAQACMQSRNWSQAIEAYEKCLLQKPEDVDILNQLGWAYLNSGNMTKAFAVWNKALKLEPGNAAVIQNLVQAHLSVAKNLRSQKAFGPALVHLKSILKLMPDQPEVYMEIGNTFAMKGDFVAAIEHWETVIRLDPSHKLAKEAIRQAKNRLRLG